LPVEPFDSNSGAPTSVEPALKPEQPRASDIDQDEEERRRAGRSGSDINPANASHSLNMRPDVTQGPAGLEVRTTMKSADYRANSSLEADLADAERKARSENPELFPEQAAHHQAVGHGDEPLPSSLEADLADAERKARTQHPEQSSERVEDRDAIGQDDAPPRPGEGKEADPADAAHTHEDDPERAHAYQLASAESTKRQDVERAARSGETVPGEVPSSATNSLAEDLRAAEKAVGREHDNDGRESDVGERASAGKSAGRSAGPSIF
jgi:hypothetical protein